MITIRTNEFQTIVKAKNILADRKGGLSDEEREVLTELEYIVVKIMYTSSKQIKNCLACKKYRLKNREKTSKYAHDYYIKNVKPKREAKRKENSNG